jgi:prepilin-type N-terminal cleavage/methylation domain
MKPFPPASPRSAFTLIELLTVIAIIGILAGILIPVVGKVRLTARKSTATANLREVGSAILLYAGDRRDGRVPGASSLAITASYLKSNDPKVSSLGAALAPYLGTKLPSKLVGGEYAESPALVCPAAVQNHPDTVKMPHYVQNYTLRTRYTGPTLNERVLGNEKYPDTKPPISLSELETFGGPARVWVLTNLDKELPSSHPGMASNDITASGWFTDPTRSADKPVWGNSRLRLYFDGHVASVALNAAP